jgi:hypothetical protein
MILWVLFALAVLVFALQLRETYTDPDSPVNPPVLQANGKIPSDWQSKIDAFSKIDANDMAYFQAIQAFYTTVYVPSETKPTDTDLEAFLAGTGSEIRGVDVGVLRKLLTSAFRIELTATAAAREEKQLVTTGALAGFAGSNLQPGNARDELYSRVEQIYTPADTQAGDRVSEGLYAETPQTKPRRPQDSGTPFADANVL